MTDEVAAVVAEYRAALKEAATLGAELANAEDRAKVVFAEMVLRQGDMAVARAEYAARASDAYQEQVRAVANVRLKAADAKARADGLEKRIEVWRTRESSRRAAMGRE